MQDKFYESFNLLTARKSVPISFAHNILDSVRNRILSFALEIEENNPDAGEACPNGSPVAKDVVQQVFNNCIFGNVGAATSGDNCPIVQTSVALNEPGDLDGLLNYFSALGLPQDDLNLLHKLLENTRTSETNVGLSNKVYAWAGRIGEKISSGAVKVGREVTVSLITEAIKRYTGL